MLTIKEQIDIFKESKERYKMYFDTFHCAGMCWAINLILKDKGHDSDIYCIHEFLPTFTHDNVKKLSQQNRFQSPKDCIALDYWWDVKESKSRISAFDALIKQLETT